MLSLCGICFRMHPFSFYPSILLLCNRQRISVRHQSCLQRQRMQDLFFHEPRRNEKRLSIGNFQLERLSSSPNIYVIDDFLNAAELEYFATKIATGTFQKSYVDNIQEDQHALVDATHRTSTFLSFAAQADAKISAIEHRAASLLGCWTTTTVEPLQLVRYHTGQFFGVHHDLGDLTRDQTTVEMPPKSYFCKRRLVTIFCYLNTVDQGGATHFPRAQLRIQPRAGRAILFSNVLGDYRPDPRTIHAGEPPLVGTKYGLNIWICED